MSETEDRAEEAKRGGIIIFTIGLGDDLDFGALERIASRPEYYYHAPSAEDLAGIYQAICRVIAAVLACPKDRWWGGR